MLLGFISLCWVTGFLRKYFPYKAEGNIQTGGFQIELISVEPLGGKRGLSPTISSQASKNNSPQEIGRAHV